jgi:hypothetical protein
VDIALINALPWMKCLNFLPLQKAGLFFLSTKFSKVRDGVGDGQSRWHFNFQVHARSTIVRATGPGSDPERSGIVLWPVRSPKGLDAHVSKSGEICSQKWRKLYLLSLLRLLSGQSLSCTDRQCKCTGNPTQVIGLIQGNRPACLGLGKRFF